MKAKLDIESLSQELEEQGLSLEKKSNHHYHITGGKFLINYYPSTQKIYVAGTTGATKVSSVEMMIRAANGDFAAAKKAKRKNKSNRALRGKMLKKNDLCCICGNPMTLDDSSLEHVIPLSKGGLNHPNNYALSHIACNLAKGSSLT